MFKQLSLLVLVLLLSTTAVRAEEVNEDKELSSVTPAIDAFIKGTSESCLVFKDKVTDEEILAQHDALMKSVKHVSLAIAAAKKANWYFGRYFENEMADVVPTSVTKICYTPNLVDSIPTIELNHTKALVEHWGGKVLALQYEGVLYLNKARFDTMNESEKLQSWIHIAVWSMRDVMSSNQENQNIAYPSAVRRVYKKFGDFLVGLLHADAKPVTYDELQEALYDARFYTVPIFEMLDPIREKLLVALDEKKDLEEREKAALDLVKNNNSDLNLLLSGDGSIVRNLVYTLHQKLVAAIRSGNEKDYRHFLEVGATLDGTDDFYLISEAINGGNETLAIEIIANPKVREMAKQYHHNHFVEGALAAKAYKVADALLDYEELMSPERSETQNWLNMAIKAGQTKLVLKMLTKPRVQKNINNTDYYSDVPTPIFVAFEQKNDEVYQAIRKLPNFDVNVEMRAGGYGNSPSLLTYLIHEKRGDLARELLAMPGVKAECSVKYDDDVYFDVGARRHGGYTNPQGCALYEAVLHRDYETLEALMGHEKVSANVRTARHKDGSSLDDVTNYYRYDVEQVSALQLAVERGDQKMVSLLLKDPKAMLIELRVDLEKSSLGYTLMHKQWPMARLLLADDKVLDQRILSMDVTSKDNSRWNLFGMAVAKAPIDIIQKMMAKVPAAVPTATVADTTSVSGENGRIFTALELAKFYKKQRKDVYEMLVKQQDAIEKAEAAKKKCTLNIFGWCVF